MSLSPDGVGDRAGNGTRTRDINLGKVALYQLSYSRKACANIPKTVSLRKNFFCTPCGRLCLSGAGNIDGHHDKVKHELS